jgi:hypothetical protein
LKTLPQPVPPRNPAASPVTFARLGSRLARGSFLGLAVASTTAALGQAYFDTRNPFMAPVVPAPPEQPVATRAGGDFFANERIPYRPAGFDEGNYNLKLGPVLVSFGSSVAFMYSSNALQSQGGGENYDLSINPTFSTNLRWQMTDAARLSLNVGVGYRFNLVQEDLSGLTVDPNTAIDYAFGVGDVLFTVFNRLSTANSADQRPDIIGTGNPLAVRFNRINNSSGLSTEWAPYTDLSLSADYTYSIERGLDDSFDSLNGDSQTVSSAVFHRLHPDLSLGISASASLNEFSNQFQNSTKTFGIGPVATWTVSEFITVSASARYTIINSEQNGQIQDSSDFAGFSGNLSVRHLINRVLNHSLSVGRGVNGALGSNFSTSLDANYQLSWQLTDFIPLNFNVGADKTEQSGGLAIFAVPPGSIYLPGDPANGVPPILVTSQGTFTDVVQTPEGLFGVPTAGQVSHSYRFGVSTGYQISQRLNSSLGWNYVIRDTDFVFGDFAGHTVTLTLSYQF